MDKKAFQPFCRFYKGGTECPYNEGNKQMFWLCEKWWAEQTFPATDAGCQLISPILKEYTDAGLSNFEMYDGVPITLKAVLFNRFCKYNERIDVEGFRALYLDIYIKG